jgi:hypothetical protein
MKLQDFEKRANELLLIADAAISTITVTAYGPVLDSAKYAEFRGAGLSFLGNTFGPSHPYTVEFARQTSEPYKSNAEAGRGIILAARNEVAGGWATTTRGIVAAEIFADFLEMAEHLLEFNDKDPAAVMIGSTLEAHLRGLAMQCGVELTFVNGKGETVHKKADTLNADLVKAGAYGIPDQKSVTAWLDLRNRAAHGEYHMYKKENVDLMLQGVRNFFSQHPV